MYSKIFWNTQHDVDKGNVLNWYVWLYDKKKIE